MDSSQNALRPAFRPLPILPTIRRAYELLWIHRAMLARLAIPAFLLLTAGTALVTRRFWGMTPDQMLTAFQNLSSQEFLPWMLVSMAATIMALAMGASWRRFLLLHQPPSAFDFHKPFLRYLLLVIVVYFASSFTLTFMLELIAMAGPAAFPLLLVGLVAIAAIVARHMLLFTALLVENTAVRWRDAAQLMRGNVARFMIVWILVFFSVMFVNQVLALVLSAIQLDGKTISGALAVGMLNAGFVVVLVAMTSSVAALTYDFLVHGGGPSAQ